MSPICRSVHLILILGPAQISPILFKLINLELNVFNFYYDQFILGPIHYNRQPGPTYSRTATLKTALMDGKYNLSSYLQKVKLL